MAAGRFLKSVDSDPGSLRREPSVPQQHHSAEPDFPDRNQLQPVRTCSEYHAASGKLRRRGIEQRRLRSVPHPDRPSFLKFRRDLRALLFLELGHCQSRPDTLQGIVVPDDGQKGGIQETHISSAATVNTVKAGYSRGVLASALVAADRDLASEVVGF